MFNVSTAVCNFAVHQSEVLQEILSLLAGSVEVSGGEGGLLEGRMVPCFMQRS